MIPRRLNVLACAFTLAAFAGVLLNSGPAGCQSKRPNVLFIAVDDLNDWVGCLGGHPQSRTPNIDRLAGQGTLFTRAYCAAPVCNPSRTAVLTGIHPITSGVYENPAPWRSALPLAVTLPECFQAAGYYTMGSGKIFHPEFPSPAAWDEQLFRPTIARPPGSPLSGIHFDLPNVDWGPISTPPAEMPDGKIAKWAIQRLQRDFNQPFFLAVGFRKPHLPWHVPKEYFDRFPLESIQTPATPEGDLDDLSARAKEIAMEGGYDAKIRNAGQTKNAVQAYLASVNFVDEQIGRVLDALEESPYLGNTIVVLWSDHGFQFGQKGAWKKSSLWEASIRVPLIIRLPGHEVPGTRNENPVSLVDLYRTLTQLCGVEAPRGVEGESLVPLIYDPSRARTEPVLTSLNSAEHSVRDGAWHYIRYKDGSEELYNLRDDPQEIRNLANEPESKDAKNALRAGLPANPAPNFERQQHTTRRTDP